MEYIVRYGKQWKVFTKRIEAVEFAKSVATEGVKVVMECFNNEDVLIGWKVFSREG